MNRHVLFFDFAYEEFLPIVRACVDRGLVPVMNQPAMREVLRREGMDIAGFEDFAVEADATAALSEARALGRRIAGAVARPGFAAAFDTPAGNLLLADGAALVSSLVNMAQNQVLIARVMRRLIAQTELRAVVMRSCLSGGQRAVQAVAQSKGIEVLELMHGNPGWDADAQPPPKHWHLALFGERDRDVYRSWDVPDGRLHVTGAPQWDGLYRPEARLGKAEARRRLGIGLDETVVLFSGTFVSGETASFGQFAREQIETHRLLLRALASLDPKPTVIVRPHPGESRNRPGRLPDDRELAAYTDLFAAAGVRLHTVDFGTSSLVADKSILFRAADCTVTGYATSTIITEAMILGCPPVVFRTSDHEQREFYGVADGVETVTTSDGLADVVTRLAGDADYRAERLRRIASAVPDLNFGDDGRATERVADVVDRLAGPSAVARCA